MRTRPTCLMATLLLGALAWPFAGTSAQADDEIRAPLPSSGCGIVEAAPEMSRSLTMGEETRGFRTHLPSGHDGQTPLPLIIWLHGQGMSASDLADVTDLPAFGEANGVVVVAPEGHRPDAGWMWEPSSAGVEPGLQNRDVAFIDALIDQLGAELCLNLARVYAGGYSIGGHGATSLACRLADRIAAVVAASGFTDLGDDCDATRAVPMLALAGTADEYVLFEGGLGDFLNDRLPWGTTKAEEPFFTRADWSLSPIERVQAIAMRNGCESDSSTVSIGQGVERLDWACPDDADVALVAVRGGGHDWLIEQADVDANELIWEFLSRFALPM